MKQLNESKSTWEMRRCLKLVSESGQREENMRLRSSEDVESTEAPEEPWLVGRTRENVNVQSLRIPGGDLENLGHCPVYQRHLK